MSVFDAEALDPRVAGFWIRALARAIDTAVGFVLSFVALIIAGVIVALSGTPGPPEEWVKSMTELSWIGMLASVISGVLYHTLSEYVGGATVGKLACGLRVLSEDFSPVSFLGAMTRSAAFAVDGFLFGWLAYRAMDNSPLRQRLGDQWGETVVVRKRAYPAAARGPARVSLGVMMGSAAYVTVLSCLFASTAIDSMRTGPARRASFVDRPSTVVEAMAARRD